MIIGSMYRIGYDLIKQCCIMDTNKNQLKLTLFLLKVILYDGSILSDFVNQLGTRMEWRKKAF